MRSVLTPSNRGGLPSRSGLVSSCLPVLCCPTSRGSEPVPQSPPAASWGAAVVLFFFLFLCCPPAGGSEPERQSPPAASWCAAVFLCANGESYCTVAAMTLVCAALHCRWSWVLEMCGL